MKSLTLIIIVTMLAAAVCPAADQISASVPGQAAIVFLDTLSASSFLVHTDDFIKSLSTYDVLSTLNVDRKVTLAEYLEYLSRQTREWTPHEVSRIRSICKTIGKKAAPLALHCPDTVLLIKSSGGDMDTAAYTRENAIILPQRFVDFDDKTLEWIITHELFHVISRANPTLREHLYALIGFKKCPPLEIPVEYRKSTIANPDYPVYTYYTEIKRSDTTLPIIPVYCARERFRPSMKVKKSRILPTVFLVALSDSGTTIVYRDGKPVRIDFSDAPDDLMLYLENTSLNNMYLFGQPEEVMAKNFEAMVAERKDLRRQWVIDSMRTFFRR